jgi:uncharacterized damage-inducible protein DinB
MPIPTESAGTGCRAGSSSVFVDWSRCLSTCGLSLYPVPLYPVPSLNPTRMRSLFLLALAASPVLAQADANPATNAARMLWEGTRDYITQAAADVPEKLYAYRPTPEVRTFGEIIGHVAGSQNMFCAMVLGEKVPAEDAVEKAAKTKAALVAELKKSNDLCARAYNTTDKANAAMVNLFDQQRSKLFTLLSNASHDAEHYGNIVTYMRMNKMVPPSSKPSR